MTPQDIVGMLSSTRVDAAHFPEPCRSSVRDAIFVPAARLLATEYARYLPLPARAAAYAAASAERVLALAAAAHAREVEQPCRLPAAISALSNPEERQAILSRLQTQASMTGPGRSGGALAPLYPGLAANPARSEGAQVQPTGRRREKNPLGQSGRGEARGYLRRRPWQEHPAQSRKSGIRFPSRPGKPTTSKWSDQRVVISSEGRANDGAGPK